MFIAMAHDLGAEILANRSEALSKRIDLWGWIKEITCPALMVWGRQDQFSPAQDGFRMSQMMPA